MAQFTSRVIMQGSGAKHIEVPKGYKYVSVINNTPDTIMLFTGQQSYEGYDPKDAIITVTQRTSITIPLGEYTSYFTIIYKEGVVGDDPQTAQIIFSVENLNINTQLGSVGNSDNVTLISDGIGLAKQTQLPNTLAAGDSLRVWNQNNITGFATSAKQDAIVTAITPQATAVKQDAILTAIGSQSTAVKQDAIITALQTLITAQNETNTKLQTLITQGQTPPTP